MGRLLLVRHGQARADDLANYDRLSPMGVEQSRLLGRWLATRGPVDRVVVGPLLRHQQTWAAMCEAGGVDWPEPEAAPDLDEHDGIAMFAHNRAAVEAAHPDLAARVAAGAPRDVFQLFRIAMVWWTEGRARTPGGEQWADFRRRVAGAVDRLTTAERTGTTTVAITSGGFVSAASGHVLDLPDPKVLMLNLATFNTSITEFGWGPDYNTMLRFNTTPHLPPDLHSHV